MRIQRLTETRRFFLSDGGLETFLIFEKGYDLPCFSAAVLLDTEQGRGRLARLFRALHRHRQVHGARLHPGRPHMACGHGLGRSAGAIAETGDGDQCAGCRLRIQPPGRTRNRGLPDPDQRSGRPAGDAYAPDTEISRQDALLNHAPQIHALGKAGADMISAMTLTHAEEAIGILQAAQEIDLPVVIAFTLETDGHLPSGQSLGDAISEVDAATEGGPLYYMINCAHPDHFRDVLDSTKAWEPAHWRHPVKCVAPKPCRTGRSRNPRRRRSD